MTPTTPRSRWAGVVLSVMVAGLVAATCSSSPAGNGEASKSGAQIFADAQRATASASSVHINGSVTSGSERITLDISDTQIRSGGSITEGGATFNVVTAGNDIFLKGSASALGTLTSSPSAGQLLGGRWLQTTAADKDFGGLAQLFNLSDFVHELKPTGSITKGKTATVDGQPAIALIDTSDNGTLYVATSGSPYILEVVGGSGEQGSVSFSQYGSVHAPAVPTGAVNLQQLEKGG